MDGPQAAAACTTERMRKPTGDQAELRWPHIPRGHCAHCGRLGEEQKLEAPEAKMWHSSSSQRPGGGQRQGGGKAVLACFPNDEQKLATMKEDSFWDRVRRWNGTRIQTSFMILMTITREQWGTEDVVLSRTRPMACARMIVIHVGVGAGGRQREAGERRRCRV